LKRRSGADAASADVDELDRYLTRHSATVAREVFAREVGERAVAAGRLAGENPGPGPVVDGGQRKWTVRGTDHVIPYPRSRTGIEIVRLTKAKRDRRARS
jgi:plasmid stabilization system protein ParE